MYIGDGVAWWNFVRKHTFDKWADKYGITRPRVPGEGFRLWEPGKSPEQRFLEKSKKALPFRYFFLYSVPEVLEDIIEFPKGVLFEVQSWIKFKVFTRKNIVDTGLGGYWHDSDEIMVSAMWQILIDFVEVECSYMYSAFGDKSVVDKLRHYFNTYRSREEGEAYLVESAKDMPDEEWTNPESAKAYQAILDAYRFVKDIKPENDAHLERLSMEMHSPDCEEKDKDKFYKNQLRLEKELNQFEEDHLKNLLTYRAYLWT